MPPGYGHEPDAVVGILARDAGLTGRFWRGETTGAEEDSVVTLNSSVESHARFADNRITTSGRGEISTSPRPSGSIGGEVRPEATTGSAEALRSLGQPKRCRGRASAPCIGSTVPTLGPIRYAEALGFSEATANVDLAARAAALEAVLASCRAVKVTGAGFHVARGSATAAATANGNRRYFRSSEGSFSVTARTASGTGSGYFAGDHFDLARLEVRRIAEQAVDKAVRSQGAKAIEPGVYPVILEPQAVADLIGFLTSSFRCADSRRGTKPVLGQGRQDPCRRVDVQRPDQSL